MLISQLVGMGLALVLAVLRGEAFPGPDDVRWAIVGGVLGGVGITMLYRALAIGRMGIVAPVTAVLAAIIPVVAGIVLEGMPPSPVLAGIALAIAAVVLVSRITDETGGTAGLREALIAGVAIGLFGVTIAQLSDGAVFGPLTIVRLTQAILVIGVVLVTRAAWRPAGRLVPVIALIGVLDMAGNSLYILAVQSGALAVASVLSSLYPVTTIILAGALLRERVTRSHALGIALAVAAIALIGLGSG